MEYRTVESYSPDRPAEVDTESSRTTVYLRKNIREVPNTDPEGNEAEGTHWLMNEAQLTKKEYADYRIARAAAELINETQTGNTETVMQAISDLQADIALMSE